MGMLLYDGNANTNTGPRGLISEMKLTANSSQNITSATSTQVSGSVSTLGGTASAGNLLLTANVTAGRKYRLTYNVWAFSSVSGDAIDISVSGPVTVAGSRTTPSAGGRAELPYTVVTHYFPSTSGSITLGVLLARASGTGNVNAAAGTSISIEDVGP